MAYTFFPKQRVEIRKTLTDFPAENVAEIENLFSLLVTKFETPINIDPKKKSNVNVARYFQDELGMTTREIADKAGLKNVTIKFGNGSSGNRGVNNRGNLFEPQFAEALLDWWEGKEIDAKMKQAIDYISDVYDLTKSKSFKVDVVGGQNVPRPLKFSPRIELTNTKGKGFDVGKTVTDLTLKLDKGKEVYLSLKLGTTTTFFNVGVRTILTPAEIQAKDIRKSEGKKLLKMFGIDEDTFCDVFNGDLARGFVDKNPSFDKNALEGLLRSGIGFGYCIVHKKSGKIHTKKMDENTMKVAARIIGKPTIYYGGKTGKGKRVDIEFESKFYRFKLNLRDTQGRDGYPTRLMCDFTDK